MFRALPPISIWVIPLTIYASANAADSVDWQLLKAELAKALPSYVRLRSLTVEASENTGDRVEPIVRSRIRARVAVLADLFQPIGTIDDRNLVGVVTKSGDEQDVYYVSTSRMYAGSWSSSFEVQGKPLYYNGQTRDHLTPGYTWPPVIQGSSEEKISGKHL